MIRNHCLVDYNYYNTPAFIADFIEFLVRSQMNVYASDVFELLELETEEEFSKALEKAVQTMQKAGIPVEEHIMPVYSDYHHHIIMDYKMSPLVFGMLTFYVEPVKENIASLQIEWLKRALR